MVCRLREHVRCSARPLPKFFKLHNNPYGSYKWFSFKTKQFKLTKQPKTTNQPKTKTKTSRFRGAGNGGQAIGFKPKRIRELGFVGGVLRKGTDTALRPTQDIFLI